MGDESHPDILTTTSITELDLRHRGKVVVSGSHGGLYPAYCAAKGGVRGVILSDAGIGKDEAGVASTGYLDPLGIAAATVAHDSARIGDGDDMLARGRISRVNATARALGCAVGMSCREAAHRMLAAKPAQRPVPQWAEARVLLREVPGEPRVWLLDSAALVEAGLDDGAICIFGSHGGLRPGNPRNALKVDALAAVFHDAGIGIEEAGIGRLPVLDQRGIAAAAVAAASARIGLARSVYEDGVLSRVNRSAAALGARPGMTTRAFVELVLGHARAARGRG